MKNSLLLAYGGGVQVFDQIFYKNRYKLTQKKMVAVCFYSKKNMKNY